MLYKSVDQGAVEGINQETMRKSDLKRSRGNLATSLVGFSINEVTRTHRVKSEFNMSLSQNRMSTGQLFS
jgi:hypothetical protein